MHVPRIRALSVKWNLLSNVILTRYRYMPALTSVEDNMVFGERFDDRVQTVAWLDSVVCLEFGDSTSTRRSTALTVTGSP